MTSVPFSLSSVGDKKCTRRTLQGSVEWLSNERGTGAGSGASNRLLRRRTCDSSGLTGNSTLSNVTLERAGPTILFPFLQCANKPLNDRAPRVENKHLEIEAAARLDQFAGKMIGAQDKRPRRLPESTGAFDPLGLKDRPVGAPVLAQAAGRIVAAG